MCLQLKVAAAHIRRTLNDLPVRYRHGFTYPTTSCHRLLLIWRSTSRLAPHIYRPQLRISAVMTFFLTYIRSTMRTICTEQVLMRNFLSTSFVRLFHQQSETLRPESTRVLPINT